MFEVKLTIEAPGLTQAMNHLADALLDSRALTKLYAEHREKNDTSAASAPTAFATAAPAVPAVPVADTSAAPVVPTAPVSTAPAPVVPVAPAPSFTLEQVGKAGADLIAADSSKMAALVALLGQFGVQAVTQLKEDQIGPFATALRGLGAKL